MYVNTWSLISLDKTICMTFLLLAHSLYLVFLSNLEWGNGFWLIVILHSPRFWGQHGICYLWTGIHLAGNPFAEKKLDIQSAYFTIWIVVTLMMIFMERGQMLLRCLIVVTLQIIVPRLIMVYSKMQWWKMSSPQVFLRNTFTVYGGVYRT